MYSTGKEKVMLWGKTANIDGYTFISGTFNTDGKFVMMHTSSFVAKISYIVVLRAVDGRLFDARQYPDSSMNLSKITRNLLMTTDGQVIVHSAICGVGVSCSGVRIFSYDFTTQEK